MRRFLLAVLVAASGCTTVSLVDDVDLELDFNPLDGPSDALHDPYVQGATFTLYIESTDKRERMADWTVESGAPDVLALENPEHAPQDRRFSVTAHALKEGVATVIVRNGSGGVERRHPIDVRVPDRVALYAHGLLLIGRGEAAAEVSEARILDGGTATYLARYYRDGQQLSGNGALLVDAPAEVTAGVAHSFLFEDRDWLQLSPQATGTFTAALSVGGTTPAAVGELRVEAVPASDVVDVAILGEDESRAHKDDWLVALAQSYDAARRPIYGVEYHWQVDDVDELGDGDLYRYQYDPQQPKMLTAQFNDLQAAVMVHSGAGFVDSTNNVGCSFAPGGRGRPLPLAAAALALSVLLLSRRRDRRRSS